MVRPAGGACSGCTVDAVRGRRVPPAAVHPAAADCEELRPGWLAQPVNALSCLAYVVAAAGTVAWSRRRTGHVGAPVVLYGAIVAANGVGGIAFHGPGDRTSRWIHDAALVGTWSAVAVLGTLGFGRLRHHPWLVGVGVATLAAGGVVDVMSRTGRPWCRPTSRLQGHALWHLLTAASLAALGTASFG
jgi:hypothetical protein